jgi:hypothetical protein
MLQHLVMTLPSACTARSDPWSSPVKTECRQPITRSLHPQVNAVGCGGVDDDHTVSPMKIKSLAGRKTYRLLAHKNESVLKMVKLSY